MLFIIFSYFILFYLFIFFFSSTSLLLPTRDPPPSCTHAQSCNPMDCSQPGSSVHGLFQARILEWVAISFSIFSYFKSHCSVMSLFFLNLICKRISILLVISENWLLYFVFYLIDFCIFPFKFPWVNSVVSLLTS